MKGIAKKWLKRAGSLEWSVSALVLLMILTVTCTLDQVNIGTFNAIDKYFRAWFLYKDLPGLGWRIPVFPAGGFVGLLLLIGLLSTMIVRFTFARKKIGIWMIHVGMILLISGEFVTGKFAVESMMGIEEGESKNYSEDSRLDEIVVIDGDHAEYDEVYSFSGSFLKPGATLTHPRLPFQLKVLRFFPNAAVGMRPEGGQLPASLANRGLGPRIVLQPQDPVSRDDVRNLPAAFVEVRGGAEVLGTWLISSAMGAPQSFIYGGKKYSLAMRPMRYHLPFTLTLKDFSHDRYAGTNIPKNYSSLVRLTHPEKSEDRDVLIYMNHPLRYEGRTFYQSSFGKNDTLSIFQVVANPGWLLPYIACAIVGLGLIVQFVMSLTGFKPRGAGRSPTASGGGTSSLSGSVGGRP